MGEDVFMEEIAEISRKRSQAAVDFVRMAYEYAESGKCDGLIPVGLVELIEQEGLSGALVVKAIVFSMVSILKDDIAGSSGYEDYLEILLLLSDIAAVAAYLQLTRRADEEFLDDLFDVLKTVSETIAATAGLAAVDGSNVIH